MIGKTIQNLFNKNSIFHQLCASNLIENFNLPIKSAFTRDLPPVNLMSQNHHTTVTIFKFKGNFANIQVENKPQGMNRPYFNPVINYKSHCDYGQYNLSILEHTCNVLKCSGCKKSWRCEEKLLLKYCITTNCSSKRHRDFLFIKETQSDFEVFIGFLVHVK